MKCRAPTLFWSPHEIFLLLFAAPTFAQGLLQERGQAGPSPNLRAVSERVRISIDHQYAETVLEQEFENVSSERLEGRYVLRTAGATVEGFAYWNGEQKIVGEVFEKQQARNLYDNVVGRKRDPGLLEWSGGNVFKARVFPIPGHSEKRIQITYTQVLPLQDCAASEVMELPLIWYT